MKEGRPPHGDRPRLPDPRRVLNRIDHEVLPKAIAFGRPKLGAVSKVVSPEASEPLSRDRLAEIVGIEALSVEAQSGRLPETRIIGDSEDRIVVYESSPGVRTLSQTHIDSKEVSVVSYVQSSDSEIVKLQHSSEGGVSRSFGLTLESEGGYHFVAERWSKHMPPEKITGEFTEREGGITEAKIETSNTVYLSTPRPE